MKNAHLFSILFAVAVLLFGCAATAVSADPEISIEDRARSVIAELKAAYENRDAARFMTLVSAQYLEGYEDLQAALEADFEGATSISLEIVPERIWIGEDNKVFMDAGWNKTVSKAGSGASEVTSGRVALIFIRYDADVLKLFSQKGNPVFP